MDRMDPPVTLPQMLEARERRALAQQRLLTQFQRPVLSFTMNIAGPVKCSPLIMRGFRVGLEGLECALTAAGLPILHRQTEEAVTGCQGLLVVEGAARTLKALCVELEDHHPLGRLFDLDVLEDSVPLSREGLGHPPRPCLVCGAPGKGCASRRLHPVEDIQKATRELLIRHFAQLDAQTLGDLAGKALLYEVCTTPKPGLVDRANCGSHRDMDVFTFLDSTTALLPYFRQAVSLGQNTAHLPPQETFRKLRAAGVAGERAMFRATTGVNTHKGAVFTLGTLCAALGRLWTPTGPLPSPADLCALCGAMSRDAVAEDFRRMGNHPTTKGGQFYRDYGLEGIRGELAAGLPSVTDIALPALEAGLAAGYPLEDSGGVALLHLIARVTDTNLVARGGLEGQQWAAQQAAALLDTDPTPQTISQLDGAFIARNLSPGGCADLLAAAYFLHLLPTTRPEN